MKVIIKLKKPLLYFILIFVLTGCMADLRTKSIIEEGITKESETKGRAILESAWKKQGFDKLSNHQTYSFKGIDTWRTLLGKSGKPWPDAKAYMELKYAIGTFDSQVKYLSGKRKNVVAGLQSWKYYEKETEGELTFMEYNKKTGFILSAFQYFTELPDRLRNTPIVLYGGETEFNGNQYEIVYATWEKVEPHMEHDQYILWVNKETGLIEYSTYTLRDNYLKPPGYKSFYGTIHYSDFRNIEGIMIPHKQTIFLKKPKKKEKKNLHQLIISDFRFDAFDIDELYPSKELKKVGDSKKGL